ncbi:right-handed parallel beta-helix repeat-containing protein [Pseudonocardia acaciae]|uniref:right-handed parallel beta-helix repeat-containing protein n=1 Tax=Pseudonocardia acaciae TaxID=551276 RepID=UPI00048A7DE7|nr:right-handed parallel beta-helix repeat-containing protein [Pseudonocardia acaciae]
MKTWRSWSTLLLGLAAVVALSLATTVILTVRDKPSSPRSRPDTAPSPPVAMAPAPAPAPSGGPGQAQPEALTGCTAQVTDGAAMTQALSSAAPGARICLAGVLSPARLTVQHSGTADRPITILGGGKAVTSGITVEADHVVIDGVIAQQPKAPGISLKGSNITVKNSASLSPQGGDGDGIRFWGSDIKILHNTVRDTRGTERRHADCMQTFATDESHPASQNVLIDSNRCEKIDNICLIAEGPNSEAGDGSGEGRSTNFVFSNNYCDNGAGQALFIDDVSNVQVINNDVVGKVNKAFAFQNDSTDATVARNRIAPGIRYEVGIDDSSERGYKGPEPGGGP